MPLDPSTLRNIAAIQSIPIQPGLGTSEHHLQARSLLSIGLETSHLIASAVETEAIERLEGTDKGVDTEIFIDPEKVDPEAIASGIGKLRGMAFPKNDFLRGIYSLTQGTLTYLDFIQKQAGSKYSLARMREEYVKKLFSFNIVYCDFSYNQFAAKSVTQSIAAFLGMYLDPVLPGSLSAFTRPLSRLSTPDEIEKNIWHHPEQLGFGAVLALQVYLKPLEYKILLQERGFIQPEVSATSDAITIGEKYLDGLRNQANPIVEQE